MFVDRLPVSVRRRRAGTLPRPRHDCDQLQLPMTSKIRDNRATRFRHFAGCLRGRIYQSRGTISFRGYGSKTAFPLLWVDPCRRSIRERGERKITSEQIVSSNGTNEQGPAPEYKAASILSSSLVESAVNNIFLSGATVRPRGSKL